MCTGSHPHAADFHNRTGHKGGLGIIPESQTIPGPGRNRDHVLERPAHFHAQKIGTGINPESRPVENRLHMGRCFSIPAACNDRRRYVPRHLDGKGRTGKCHASRLRRILRQDTAHRQVCVVFNPLRHGDNDAPESGQGGRDLSKGLRGDRNDHDVRTANRAGKLGLQAQPGGKGNSRQEPLISPGAPDLLEILRHVTPKRHPRSSGLEHPCEGGPPGTGT